MIYLGQNPVGISITEESYADLVARIDELSLDLAANIIISNTEPTEEARESNKIWINEDEDAEYLVPTYEEFSGLVTEEELLRSELVGVTQTVTFDNSGNPSTIVYTKNGTTVRTDTFTWTASSVTEVRTLSSGKHITLTTNLTTLETVISEVLEAV